MFCPGVNLYYLCFGCAKPCALGAGGRSEALCGIETPPPPRNEEQQDVGFEGVSVKRGSTSTVGRNCFSLSCRITTTTATNISLLFFFRMVFLETWQTVLYVLNSLIIILSRKQKILFSRFSFSFAFYSLCFCVCPAILFYAPVLSRARVVVPWLCCVTVLCQCTSQTAAAPHFSLHAAAALCLCHMRP